MRVDRIVDRETRARRQRPCATPTGTVGWKKKPAETARELVAPAKGILAADESFGTIGKRFEAFGIESSEESRRAYREMLFTTEGIGEFLSGVILFDETIRQETSDGT